MRQAFAILAMFVLLAACGGNGCASSPISMGTGGVCGMDGASGASGATCATHVTVHVTDQSQQPIAGAAIVVNDATGVVTAVAMSGTDGRAPAVVPRGGSVAASSTVGLTFETVAVFEPPDGATVNIVLSQVVPASPRLPDPTTYQDKVSQIPPAARELALYTCATAIDAMLGAPATPSVVFFTLTNEACPVDATSSVLTIASDASGTPLAWDAALDQPIAPGSLVDVSQVLRQTAFDTLAASITAIPSGAAQTSIDVSIDVSGVVAAQAPLAYDVRQVAAGSPPSYTAQFSTPSGLFSSYGVEEHVSFDAASAESYVLRQRTYAHLPATTTFAADAMALVSVAPLDITDPAHPRATWSVGAGPQGDYTKVTLGWTSGTASHLYTAVFPSDQPPSFRLPDAPADLASYAPSATSTFSIVMVDNIDEETATGYAQSSIFQTPVVVDGLGVVTSGGLNLTASP